MSPRKRITKHMMKEDKLVTTTFRVTEWVQKNSQKILMGAGAVAAVAVVIFIFFSMRAQRNEKANQLLGQATMDFRTGSLNQAISKLETISSKYGGTKAAPQAIFLLGNIYFHNRQFDQAISIFEKFTKKGADDPLLMASSLFGIAQCYLEKKEYGQAGDFFQRAFESDRQGVLAANSLVSAGFSYSRAKDLEKAKSSYQKVVELFPQSQEALKARRELAEINYSYAEQ